MPDVWHNMRVEEVLGATQSSRQGLTSDEAGRRLREYGPNELRERKRATPLQIFLNQFKDVFVAMLLAAVGVSLLIGETTDALIIATIVGLNAVVGFVQEYRSEKAIEAMKKFAAPKARVLRDEEMIIPAREVVPGDILLLEAGDRIAADGRLIEVVELKTDEALLTGESTQISKTAEVLDEKAALAERRNLVFMATHITYGRGKAIATSTGMRTEFGRIAEMVETIEEEQTPLKQKLERFAKNLAVVVLVVCAVVFALELYGVLAKGAERGEITRSVVEAFQTAIALAVSAVPEGLPAVVTVSLALGARDLARRNAIIRRLSSAETLGATTVICSDKTGTLTKGEMTVRGVYANRRIVNVTGAGYDSRGDFLDGDTRLEPRNDLGLDLLLKAGALCNNAQYDGRKVIGDTTEGALLVAAAKATMTKKGLENMYPRVREIPFTSERKRMTTIHRTSEGKLIVYMKGAPEVLLERSTRIFDEEGLHNLSAEVRKSILGVNEQMAGEALRVLGLAYRELPDQDPNSISEEEAESDLVFLGLVGMIDPPREEAKEAIEKCRQAGIKTVMITGDHKLTGAAVARELGMLGSATMLTGAELDEIGDEEFEKTVQNVSVYARVSPEHKLRIVKALQKRGQIVAMTGDGVNDAPALKQADIGVAMGITGTDVTREAADMVLADDNFATIVNAVEGGRTIYDNLRKFSFFLLRCNFDELGIIAIFALLGLELPLVAGMILWLNLVTDGGPALALTMDPPEEDVMKRPPRNPNEGILHGRFASILATFITQFALTGGLFYWQYYLAPGALTAAKLAKARTMAFMRATLQEVVVVWNCRSERRNAFRTGFLSNKYLLVSVIGSVALTLVVPYVGLFGTIPLADASDWAIVILASLSGLLIVPEIFYGRRILRWT